MKVHLEASGFELSSELEKYAHAKVARITRRIIHKRRTGASCTVVFTQKRQNETKFNTCNITVIIGETTLQAEETTLHMYAALDVAAVHIEQQLRKCMGPERQHGVAARLRRYGREDWLPPQS